MPTALRIGANESPATATDMVDALRIPTKRMWLFCAEPKVHSTIATRFHGIKQFIILACNIYM